MARAVAGGATRHNLPTLGDETLQRPHIFVIDCERLVGAKTTDLASSATGSATTAGTITAAAFTAAVGSSASAAVLMTV